MNQSKHSFVTSDEILSDVVRVIQDSDFRANSKGYYLSLIQQALEELAFDTYFDQRDDVFPVPADGRLDMPKGAFNIRQIYAFNGDKCDIGTSKNVYFKRNFIRGGSSGFVARNKGDNGNDPFYGTSRARRRGINNTIAQGDGARSSDLLYYGMQNGVLMFSDTVLMMENLFIVFDGTGGEIGEVPFIPTFLRQAVKDWVSSRGLEVKISQSVGAPEFTSWQSIKAGIDARLNKPYTGSWEAAEFRVKQMDSKEREDYKEYMSRMDL